MIENYLHTITVFENYSLTALVSGKVSVSTKVVNSSLNYYGNAHGGYLFTLCDQVAGLVVISMKKTAVTMQSSINYMRAGHLGDCLTITGICVHKGQTTMIVEVTITNQEEKAVAKGAFTMYITGDYPEFPDAMS